jgi:4-hydroxy-L-threonine phosphate dehydrogenase PdxA
MFLVSEQIRVGVVTGHIPLGRVRSQVTPERISQKLTMMLESLTNDFGIQKPKVAVLGLNPHAGEDGLLGSEEKTLLLLFWSNSNKTETWYLDRFLPMVSLVICNIVISMLFWPCTTTKV